jgi:uncharacterized phiE125 gp8 family phage protein
MSIDDYAITVITAPSSEPLTLAEVKKHLELSATIDAHDTKLTTLIATARERAEAITNRQLMTATLELRLDEFPRGNEEIKIPRAPLQSVTSVKYQDTADTQQTLDAARYKVVTSREPGEIHPKFGYYWPTAYYEDDVVVVRFVAGYTSAANVPNTIKLAMLMMVSDWFWDRVGTNETPTAAMRLLEQNRYGDSYTNYGGEE